MKATRNKPTTALLALVVCALSANVGAQKRASEDGGEGRRGAVQAITIPVTLRLPEKREPQTELQYIDVFTVLEDGEKQEILATRGGPRSPLTLEILIQDDLVPSVGIELKSLADFVRRLPAGSRVMVGYLRVGSLQVRQKFTNDLERAAKSLRIPIGSSGVSPYNPYSETRDAVKRFESQPVGRRAVLLVSDGVDISRGIEGSLPSQSMDLQRAINEAQRRGAAVYTIYAPTVGGSNRTLISNGQGSLNRLSDETGGRSFLHGTDTPVSFEPYLREINTLLSRQFALTYLSTHGDRGFHKVRIVSDLTEGEIHHPTGYTR
ncbi:MAG: hypothetical protein LC754_02575 [Acidobacteria bacterium]|nr:hypothetical protein [Acidobacteriota bacterium]